MTGRERIVYGMAIRRSLVQQLNASLRRYDPNSLQYHRAAEWSVHLVLTTLSLYQTAAREGRSVDTRDVVGNGKFHLTDETRKLAQRVYTDLNLTKGARRRLRDLQLPDHVDMPTIAIKECCAMTNRVFRKVRTLEEESAGKLLILDV